MLKLSVLDQSTSSEGLEEGQSIRDTLELAQLCDSLGYHRFWVSEHHNHPTIVGSAPEILISAIAQTTKRIRIGSAGVMLPHYAPLKVAEQFRVLEAMAPGRIDLGLGRAPGSDSRTAFALNPNSRIDAEHFPLHVRDLIGWLTERGLEGGHPFQELKAHPTGPTQPEVWMLGTSEFGAQVAANLGIPYCFAHFITDGKGAKQALDLYRSTFRPSELHPTPKANICIWALAAKTNAEAVKLFSSRAFWKINRDLGFLSPLQDPTKLEKDTLLRISKKKLTELNNTSIFGSVDCVKTKILEMAEYFELDEIVILTWTHNQEDRRRSYKLLAAAFNL